jgi:Uncharacterized protein conserved in bacteria (DUF2252)
MSEVRRQTRGTSASGGRAPSRTGGLHLSPAERQQRGRDARARIPRSSHARFEGWPGRPDPLYLLERQAETRVPELVPVRYGRMAVSPFTFYRGAALVMASDLSSTKSTGITVQCCGDAHLSNFGAFGTPERQLVLDVNDFAETYADQNERDFAHFKEAISSGRIKAVMGV